MDRAGGEADGLCEGDPALRGLRSRSRDATPQRSREATPDSGKRRGARATSAAAAPGSRERSAERPERRAQTIEVRAIGFVMAEMSSMAVFPLLP